MLNCTHGTIDDSNFGRPMPIIGLYIAGATLLTAILMFIDLVKGIKSKQLWIPCNFFPIDAATLTAIAIAVKLSVDLNSPMPSKEDQLAKLSTSAYMCTVLAYSQPSLAKLEKGELRANTIALALLVITSVVNLCIQLATGVILSFRKAHIFMIVMMLLTFRIYIGTAVDLGTLKHRFQLRFEKMHRQILEESLGNSNVSEHVSTKMEDYLKNFSMAAQSTCPQFLLSKSSIYVPAFLYGYMAASVLVYVVAATITHKDKKVGLNTCTGDSDYGWSVLLIVIAQAIAIVVGLTASLCRWIYPKYFLVLAGSVLSWLLLVWHILGLLWNAILFTFPPYVTMGNLDLITSNHHPYYMFWRDSDEENYDAFMVESCSRLTQKYLDAETVGGPKYLINLLKDHLSDDFRGVLIVGKNTNPPIIGHRHTKPTNSWALPMLTLTCVATALPLINKNSKRQLRESVIEGLAYVKLVEENLNGMHSSDVNMVAAEFLAKDGLYGRFCWFNVDLMDLANTCITTPKEVMMHLAETAKKRFRDDYGYRVIEGIENSIAQQTVVSYSMYEICQTILQDYENENNLDPSSHEIFEKLRRSIADILGACLLNLKQYILQECKRSNIEKRRETAFRMLKFFSKTKGIFEMLENEDRKIPHLLADKSASIDEWCSYLTRHRAATDRRKADIHYYI